MKLTETSTGYIRTATTDSAGLFTFPNLNVGTYSLDVTAKGFQNYHASGIVLNVSPHAAPGRAIESRRGSGNGTN